MHPTRLRPPTTPHGLNASRTRASFTPRTPRPTLARSRFTLRLRPSLARSTFTPLVLRLSRPSLWPALRRPRPGVTRSRFTPRRLSAAVVLATAGLVLGAFAVPAHGAGWLRPVPGAVMHRFAYGSNPFRRGLHRGIDLEAAPGTAVRAPCAGRVVFAGRAPAGEIVVTVRCGGWRVTALPLATLSVRRGAWVAPGARLGTVAAGAEHGGLHLGVRRANDRFGYVNPLRFFRGADHPVPPTVLARRDARRGPPPGPRPAKQRDVAPRRRPAAAPRPAALPRGAPVRPTTLSPPSPARRAPHPPSLPRVAVPWLAWPGLALLLSGAVGGWTWRRRERGAAAAPVLTGDLS